MLENENIVKITGTLLYLKNKNVQVKYNVKEIRGLFLLMNKYHIFN